jgi:DNA polymerase-3 subunit epsilon
LFAIVDIETTGGSASNGAITEVSILLHDGHGVTDRFTTLLNPGCSIPHYITALTGINNQMVAHAPSFPEIARKLFDLLQNRVFIAHNVNFDHSFLHHHFKLLDMHFQPKKLCTVRYAKKLVNGLPSYSLGNLCRALGIPIENRHRAAGDAEATAKLFDYLRRKDENGKVLQEMTKGRNAHAYLPMNVPIEMIEQLPYCPGVYYFKNKFGKVVYVGKAVNIKYRVKTHFTNNAAGRRRQEMLRNIYSIEYKVCATELMALILESIEIKRLWPLYNRSQKRQEEKFGLYVGEDKAGRKRVWINKKLKNLPSLYNFTNLAEGHEFLKKMARKVDMKPEWLLAKNIPVNELPEEYNQKISHLVETIRNFLPDFAYVEKGEDELGKPTEVAYIVQQGAFKGMLYSEEVAENWNEIVQKMETFPENEFIRSILYNAVATGSGYLIKP